ncbi:S1 family peptidase [Bdellovibrio sp. HCB337]|uniref:S1 family peptidase n=1 Tax=Bdellovibrio sp. HCB337 TaxID=3394358 RepID=UPI0039A5989A
MRSFRIVMFISALFGIAACAPSNSSLNDLSSVSGESIIDGTRVNTRPTTASKSIVYLELLNEHGQEISYCTAALIGPNTVLTAAHCFDDNLVRHYTSFNVVFENQVTSSWGPRVARRGVASLSHPKYNTERSKKPYAYDHDIAVASFAGDFPKGFATVKMDSDASANYAGLSVYVYGFGRFKDYVGDDSDFGRSGGTGLLRKGVMQIDLEYTKFADRYFTSVASETFLCQGDSGGPQFYHENGVLKVIGVNSASTGIILENGRQTCRGPSQVTKVAPFYTWLSSAQKKLSGRN